MIKLRDTSYGQLRTYWVDDKSATRELRQEMVLC
jgi:hypothetical protein